MNNNNSKNLLDYPSESEIENSKEKSDNNALLSSPSFTKTLARDLPASSI